MFFFQCVLVLRAWQFTLVKSPARTSMVAAMFFYFGPQEDRPKVAAVITTLIRSSRAGGRMRFDLDVPNTKMVDHPLNEIGF